MRYIGTKNNLTGNTPEENAILDMVAGTLDDIRWQALIFYSAPEYPELKHDWKSNIPDRLSDLNEYFSDREFVLGKTITWVDFLAYESFEWYRQFAPEIFEQELKNLGKFQKRVEELEQVKEYHGSERFKPWPFFSHFVHFGHSKVRNLCKLICLKKWLI